MFVNSNTIHVIQEVIRQKGAILLPAHGQSMYPFIRQGDVCHFAGCDSSALEKGDVVLFQTASNQLVAHRFIKQTRVNRNAFFIFKGDTNLLFDEPILPEQIIGKMTIIERKQKRILIGKFTNHLWGKLLINVPITSKVLHKWIRLKGHVQF